MPLSPSLAAMESRRHDPALSNQWPTENTPPTFEIGTTGLRHAAGFVNEEFLSRLRGQPGVAFYREVWDNSAVVGAVMFMIQAVLRECSWSVEAVDDLPESKKWQEHLESCMKDMDHTWEDFISEIMSFLIFGWAWFELVFKLRKGETGDPTTESQFEDGAWGIRKIEMRGQDSLWQWHMDRSGELLGMIQLDVYNQAGLGPVMIPLEKSLHFVTRRFKNNPEGYPLLRPVTGTYHYVKRMQEIEAIGWSKDLVGTPHMTVPTALMMANASADNKALYNTIKTMLQQFQVDERGCVITPPEFDDQGKPTGFKLSLLQSGGRRTIDTSMAIQRYNVQIMQCFGADFLQVGQSNVGTRNVFEGKANLFLLGLTHYLDVIESTLNRNLVPKLCRLNGVPRKFWPQFRHGKLDKPDLDALGTFLQKLGSAGLLSPSRKLEGHVLEIADLPKPDDDDTAIYEDLTRPTPSEPKDMVKNLGMSDEQAKAVMEINAAVAGKKLAMGPAIKLIASRLGVDDAHAKDFLEEIEKEPMPAALAGGPVPPKPGTPIAGTNAAPEAQQEEEEP